MANQKSGGNKKRTRRSRVANNIFAQGKRKEKWLTKLKNNPKIQKKKKRDKVSLPIHETIINATCTIRPITFEEQYKLFRKTKGRKGLNPNPDKRGEENYYLTHPEITSKFPITSLMEKPIKYKRS